MRIIVLVWILISLAGSEKNDSKPIFPKSLSENDSTEDIDLTSESTEQESSPNFGEIQAPSVNTDAAGSLDQRSIPVDVFSFPPGVNSLQVLGFDRNSANNYFRNLSSLGHDESHTERPAYKRVYVGKDYTGSDIYSSSPKLERASYLAKKLRTVYGDIGVIHNTHGGNLTHMFKKPSVRPKTEPNISENLPSFDNIFNCDGTLQPIDYSGRGSSSEVFELPAENDYPSSDMEMDTTRSTTSSLSRTIFSKVKKNMLKDSFMIISVNNSSFSLEDSSAIAGNVTFSRTESSCSVNFQLPVSTDQSILPTPASDEVVAETLLNEPPFRSDFCRKSSLSTSDKKYLSKPGTITTDLVEPRMDDSLNNFVTAVNALQTLVENLDENFGSARRLRESLEGRPQQSGDLIEEISRNLQMMSDNLCTPEVHARYRGSSQIFLNDILQSVVHLNEEIWQHIIAYNNCSNAEEQRECVEYLLAILRELRNQVDVVVQQAQPVLEYFQMHLNYVGL